MKIDLTDPPQKTRPRPFRYVSGQRLSMYVIVMLLLFFTVSSYITSAQNHELVKKATQDRSVLIVTTGQLSDLSNQELNYIQKLLAIVQKQNDALKKDGQPIIVVPLPPEKPFILTTPSGIPAPKSNG